jgi:hypothetical protein
MTPLGDKLLGGKFGCHIFNPGGYIMFILSRLPCQDNAQNKKATRSKVALVFKNL